VSLIETTDTASLPSAIRCLVPWHEWDQVPDVGGSLEHKGRRWYVVRRDWGGLSVDIVPANDGMEGL
jgi:hypothetical protein